MPDVFQDIQNDIPTLVILSVSTLLVFFLFARIVMRIVIPFTRGVRKRKRVKPTSSLCADWAEEKDGLERFRQRLVFETGASDLADVRVWKRRSVNVQIRSSRYPGEYAIPCHVDLDTITLNELLEYRQSKIIDEKPIPLGIAGLDDILEGGAYAGEVYAIVGPVKSGRTLTTIVCASAIANRQERVIVAHGEYDRSRLTVAMRPFLSDDRAIERVRSVHYGDNTPIGDVIRLLDRVIVGARDIGVVILDGLEMIPSGVGTEKRDDDESVAGQQDVVIDMLRKWAMVHGCAMWVTVRLAGTTIPENIRRVADGCVRVSFDADAKTLALQPVTFRRVAVPQKPVEINIENAQLTAIG